MNILSIDVTDNKLLVVASKDENIVYKISEETGKKHNCLVVPYIEEILTKLNLDINDIDVFSCVVGPGSFTGIRIGIATIKALSFATSKKCVSINSLEAYAYQIKSNSPYYCAIDAMHGNCYAAKFDTTWEKQSNMGEYCYEDLINNGNIVYLKDKIINPETLIEITKIKANRGFFEDLMPLYLKKSQAEIEKDGKH